MTLAVTHLVRRYGPVGGMESYVWHLTHALSELGVSVRVLCETLCEDPMPEIQVECVPKPVSERPRWKAMRHYREMVNQRAEQGGLGVIHSHERSLNHQVTTFHGPPMGRLLKDGPWWKRIQPRIKAWGRYEFEELCGPQVRAVIPVSSGVADTLKALYPEVADRMTAPGWPGLSPDRVRQNQGSGNRVLFVGREWKRKGLDIALETWSCVHAESPSVSLDVYGVDRLELPRRLLALSSEARFHGWQSQVPFEEYDVLIHPAREEPFGMIIPEARAAGLSVLTSNQVGAVDLPLSGIRVVDIDSEVSEWADALRGCLETQKPPSEAAWHWEDLAKWHLTEVYSRCRDVECWVRGLDG